MTIKERNEQKKKLIENLNICKAQMKEAHENVTPEELNEAKQNYYKTLIELDNLQPKRKN